MKRVDLVESATSSGSVSNGNTFGMSTRRKKLRVISEEDGSAMDTSGPGTDSETVTKPSTAVVKQSGLSPENSDGETKRCSICIEPLKKQTVGVPEHCEHMFCLDCIMKWSKKKNTCPVDRSTFTSITVKSCWNGRVLRIEPVTDPVIRLMMDPTSCQICGSPDSEETTLLCDQCDRGFHMACLTPSLERIPRGHWFCPDCSNIQRRIESLLAAIVTNQPPDRIVIEIGSSMSNVLLSTIGDNLIAVLEDNVQPPPIPIQPHRQVRNLLRSNRNNPDQPSTSSGSSRSNANASTSSRNTTTRRTRTAPTRRSSRRTCTIRKTVKTELKKKSRGRTTTRRR